MSILAIEFSRDDLRDTNVLTQRLQQHFDESARVKLEFVGTHLVGSHPNVRGIVCCIRAWQRREPCSTEGMFHFANTIREIYLLKLWKIKYVDWDDMEPPGLIDCCFRIRRPTFDYDTADFDDLHTAKRAVYI